MTTKQDPTTTALTALTEEIDSHLTYLFDCALDSVECLRTQVNGAENAEEYLDRVVFGDSGPAEPLAAKIRLAVRLYASGVDTDRLASKAREDFIDLIQGRWDTIAEREYD